MPEDCCDIKAGYSVRSCLKYWKESEHTIFRFKIHIEVQGEKRQLVIALFQREVNFVNFYEAMGVSSV